MTTNENILVSRPLKLKETPEQKFRRIATRRARAILKYLRLLGNTANLNTYKFSKHEVDTIFAALKKALAETEAKFLTVHEDNFEL